MRQHVAKQALCFSILGIFMLGMTPVLAQQIKMGPSVIKLLSKGKKPYQTLRYKLRKGSKYRMNITMHMNMKMSIQVGKQAPIPRKVNIPPMELVNDLHCLSISQQGAAEIRVRLIKAKPIKTPGMNAGLLAALQRELHRIRGLSMRLTFSAQGMLVRSRIEHAPQTSKKFQQLMTNIQNTFRQIATPLPSKAVGQGAVWQVSNQLSQPIRLTQLTTYTLVKKQGSFLRLHVKMRQQAKEQVRLLKTPRGKMKLKMSISSKGRGNNTLQLSQLWIRSGLQVLSDMRVVSLIPKNRQHVRTLMNIKTYVRSSPFKKK